MLLEYYCNWHARWSGATVYLLVKSKYERHGCCNRPAGLVKLLQNKTAWFQKCVLVMCHIIKHALYVCWPCGNYGWAAGLVQVEQICTLTYAAARWILCWTVATKSSCWSFVTQSCMSVGVVLLYLPYLLAWCLTISHACLCDASLKAILSWVEPNYHSFRYPCL